MLDPAHVPEQAPILDHAQALYNQGHIPEQAHVLQQAPDLDQVIRQDDQAPADQAAAPARRPRGRPPCRRPPTGDVVISMTQAQLDSVIQQAVR